MSRKGNRGMGIGAWKSLARATGLCALILVAAIGTVGARANVAPVVDSFTASLATVPPGGTVALTVTAHDPDCSGTCTTGCGLVVKASLTAWTANGGSFTGINNGADGSPYTASAQWVAPAAEGSYTLTVTLKDSGSMFCGGVKTTSATLNVQVSAGPANQSPVITSLIAVPSQLFPGGTAALTAEASDPDGDPVTYAWSATQGTITPGAPGSASFLAPPAPGSATVTCTVTDSRGATATKSLALLVADAAPEPSLTSGLINPVRVACSSSGDLFVADPGVGGLVQLNDTGDVLAVFRVAGITSVALDWLDRPVVGSQSGAAILDAFGQVVVQLSPGGALNGVTDVAVDQTGQRIAVLYGQAGRVFVFGPTGSVLSSFGASGNGPGQFYSASGLAITSTGQFLVADAGHGLIHLFDASGTHLNSFGGFGTQTGQFTRLAGLASDASGKVYAVDPFQSHVVAFQADGTPRETLGAYGTDAGQLMTPSGLAVDGRAGKLYVASVNSSRIAVYRFSPSDPTNRAPSTPTPTGPPPSAVILLGTAVRLEVLNSTDPENQPLQYDFELYYDSGPPTDQAIRTWRVPEGQDATGVDATPYATGAGFYHWRARAFDGAAYSAWCADQRFQITLTPLNHPPTAPMAQGPLGGSEVPSLVPALTVADSTDADGDPISYTFEVAILLGGAYQTLATSSPEAETPAATSWQVPAGTLAPSQEILWRCRASDGKDDGPWSAYEAFWTPPFSIPEAGEYGNIPGGDQTRATQVRYLLAPSSAATTLYFEVYDVSAAGELTLEVNGMHTHEIPAQVAGGWSNAVAVTVTAAELNGASPTGVRFLHAGAADAWGVRKVSLTPPPEIELLAHPYNTVIDLAWNMRGTPAPGTTMRLYRYLQAGGQPDMVNSFELDERSMRDAGLTNGVTYYYKAAYVDALGVEFQSTSLLPATPTGGSGPTPVTDLRVIRTGQDLLLSWTPVTSDPPLVNFEVYSDLLGAWQPDTGTFTNLLGMSNGDGFYTITSGAEIPDDHWFKVLSLDANGVRSTP